MTKTANQEHLEAVADRNARIYFDNESIFRKYMLALSWEPHEIDKMIKHLKRKREAIS